MALQISKPTEFSDNINITYWKIISLNIDWHNRSGVAVIGGFLSMEDRIALKKPVSYYHQHFIDSFPFDADRNTLQDAYNYIKTLPDWQGSLDIL